MSSIAGFFNPNQIYTKEDSFCEQTIVAMANALKRRGPDKTSFASCEHGRFNHNELSCSHLHPDIPYNSQPLQMQINGAKYLFLMDGTISNLTELKKRLMQTHVPVHGLSQEALILSAFVSYGPSFVKFLCGGFAIAIYDQTRAILYLFRDQLGIKPLFYAFLSETLLFASEPKGILAYPKFEPVLNAEAANELLSLGPAHTPGKTLYKGMSELKPGHFLVYAKEKLYTECYHRFQIKEHTDSYEDTLDHIKELLDTSFQTASYTNEAFASLLSGGLDSSIVSAKLAACKKETPFVTYSLDFTDSSKYFQANSFQPSLDAPFVQIMQKFLNSRHRVITCSNADLFQFLKPSVEAHDGPAMADVDSSLYFFCKQIAPRQRIIFTGECADELFCGYPWYHRSEMKESNSFPWTNDASLRLSLLNENIISSLQCKDYIHAQYLSCCKELSLDGDNTPAEALHQKTFLLTVRYFMQTLIDRTDRIASHLGIDARVPFADLRLAEYLFNLPYDLQAKEKEPKHLLRCYATNLIPDEIRLRKKSPFPKTYDPGYESFLIMELQRLIQKKDSPLFELVDAKKLSAFCYNPKDLGKPWYGQLMAGPQLLAYYLQIHDWLVRYNVKLEL